MAYRPAIKGVLNIKNEEKTAQLVWSRSYFNTESLLLGRSVYIEALLTRSMSAETLGIVNTNARQRSWNEKNGHEATARAVG